MDPWNIAGVVLAASKVAWHIGIFWQESGNAPTEISASSGKSLLSTRTQNLTSSCHIPSEHYSSLIVRVGQENCIRPYLCSSDPSKTSAMASSRVGCSTMWKKRITGPSSTSSTNARTTWSGYKSSCPNHQIRTAPLPA